MARHSSNHLGSHTPRRLQAPGRRSRRAACCLAFVMLGAGCISASSLPALAQQGHPAPHSSAAPAAASRGPSAQAQRGGYLQPHSQPQSPAYGQPGRSTTPLPTQRYEARPAPPPSNSRPLITARPYSGGPATPPGFSTPRSPYTAPAPNPGRGNQQHLGGWLQSHSGQSFSSQEQSLRQEPGFSHLPQPQQQRLIDRLHQIDTMPPQRRERTLGRIENLERLSPDRRQQVRSSAQELSNMPEDRKQQVRGAFRALRDLPPEQRQQQLESPDFRTQYSPHERQILGNLLSVEPYQPR